MGSTEAKKHVKLHHGDVIGKLQPVGNSVAVPTKRWSA